MRCNFLNCSNILKYFIHKHHNFFSILWPKPSVFVTYCLRVFIIPCFLFFTICVIPFYKFSLPVSNPSNNERSWIRDYCTCFSKYALYFTSTIISYQLCTYYVGGGTLNFNVVYTSSILVTTYTSLLYIRGDVNILLITLFKWIIPLNYVYLYEYTH